MSTQARIQLVNSTVIRDESAVLDLLNVDPLTGTNTDLIALLLDAVDAAKALACVVLITSVRSDHSDDASLGLHSHANGYCADTWLLNSRADGDYVDALSPTFTSWLSAVRTSPWLYQIGLAGSAATTVNLSVVAPIGFIDDGADHVHLGAHDQTT
jgi:hypothetical protein